MSKRVPSPVGSRLQEARQLAGISARELDRLADITEGHASLIESGVVQKVTNETVAKFARALGVTTDWLITGEGSEPTEKSVRAAVEAARAAYAKSSNTDAA